MERYDVIDESPLRVSPQKWSNTLKQFVGNLLTNCFSVFEHSLELTFKGLSICTIMMYSNKNYNYPISQQVSIKGSTGLQWFNNFPLQI